MNGWMKMCMCLCVLMHTVRFSTCACVWVSIGRNHWEFPSVFRYHTVTVWTTFPQVISCRWCPSLQDLRLGEGIPIPSGALCSTILGNTWCPDGSKCVVCHICIYSATHTHTHTHSHTPMSSLSFRSLVLLPSMLGPHFVLTSTYPPSAVSRLAQVCTAGLYLFQAVILSGIIWCSACHNFSHVLHSNAKLETGLKIYIHKKAFLLPFRTMYLPQTLLPFYCVNLDF